MVEVREKVPTGHAGRWGGAVINQLVGRDVKLQLGVYKLRNSDKVTYDWDDGNTS